MPFSAAEIAQLIGAEVSGDGAVRLSSIAGVESAVQGQLAFVANRKYQKYLTTTQASAVIVSPDTVCQRTTLLLHPEPYFAFMKAMRLFHPPRAYDPGVHPTAVVPADAVVDRSAHIGAHVVLEDHARIGAGTAVLAGSFIGMHSVTGDNCLIYPNVTIREDTQIGNRVIIHSGTVIGSDGFGYATSGGVHHKIMQVGKVVIEDDVEIGANVTIDRATIGETRIGRGSKIDNLVQIAHNVKVGEGCILVSQVGVSGSTKLGHHVVAGGQVGFVGHIEVGDGAQVGAQSGVARDVEAGKTVFGSPARDIADTLRIEVCIAKLPQSIKRLRDLEKEVKKLTEKE
jgi:UDP-3-O-[3-hydroxymyristoyl] glucosamine N-acyltransferase